MLLVYEYELKPLPEHSTLVLLYCVKHAYMLFVVPKPVPRIVTVSADPLFSPNNVEVSIDRIAPIAVPDCVFLSLIVMFVYL